ncbi:uncharacterized protein LOC120146069 [Hibiscus syriacus]|uniref:uncharacterized protein LOC120146069 n=1 Tax=Hibiscus syriacus TaxID=106335 RepID=UPI001921050B|nr:uncharacterized protein LOC120146069 [Hibiscus syriacus]
MEMFICSMLIFLHFQFFIGSQSATIMVDGVSHWENPTVHVGDSLIFKHKYEYKLYIFQNKNAFNLCNFTQASLLTKHNSTSYEWHPSRPGIFYFTFNNGSLKTCRGSQRLSIKVHPATISPELPAEGAPAPTSGGTVVSSLSHAYPWPFRPRQAVSPAPSAASPVAVPSLVPDKGGDESVPFISSNPAVPLPTGEVDSTTIRPLPTSGQAVVGILTAPMALFSMAFLAL